MFKRLSKMFICLFLSIITLFGCSSVEDYNKYLTFEPISATECSVKLNKKGHAASKIVIPNKYEDFNVTSISSKGFYNARYLKEIFIPNSVASIGDYAFRGCTSLTSIVIPDSVTSIGESAFYDCYSLTSVTIGDSVTSIGSSAFYGCSSLKSVFIPDSVTSIGESAFYGCGSLTSVTICDSVTSIGDYVFYHCYNLTIYCEASSEPSGWSSNWNSSNCPVYWGMNSFVEQNGMQYALTNDETAIIIKYVGNDTEVVIPSSIEVDDVTYSVTSIGNLTFYYCDFLTSVTIGDSVTSIGVAAFYRCSSLTSIIIPDSVTSIGNYAFNDCYYLTIYCEASSEPSGWSSNWNSSSRPVYWGVISFIDGIKQNGIQYLIINGKAVVSGYVGDDTEVIIPPSIEVDGVIYSVTTIGGYAFHDCNSLTSIVIPDSVTLIGGGAFYFCFSLTSIVIPDSVTFIGEDAFYRCSSLTIYCEVESQPSGWSSNWNSSNRPVIWGWKE